MEAEERDRRELWKQGKNRREKTPKFTDNNTQFCPNSKENHAYY